MNATDFVRSENLGIVKDVTVLNKFKSSDHQLVRRNLDLSLRKECAKLMNKIHHNISTVKRKQKNLQIHKKFPHTHNVMRVWGI